MTPVYVQIKIFLNTIAIGLIMGIVFDFYRALRGLVRPKKWTTGLSDLIVCLFLTCLVFLLLIFSNWGEVRVYVFLGLAIGLAIHFKYLSDLILQFWYNWFAFLGKSLRLMLKTALLPFVFVKMVFAFPLGVISLMLFKLSELFKPFFGKLLKKTARWLKTPFCWRRPKE